MRNLDTQEPLQVEYRPIDRLIPYARNSRTHTDAQVAQIAASIREFGWTNPVLVDGENGIVAGHARVLAARKLGVTDVPVIELSGMTEAQKQAYVLADNQLALNAGWDEDLLALELKDLKDVSFDLSTIGFSDRELQSLLRRVENPTEGLIDPDDIPDMPREKDVWVRPGELYLLGDHRLLCADATNAGDVEKLMSSHLASLLATDPPYLVNYTGGNHLNSKQGGSKAGDDHWDSYHGDEQSVAFYSTFLNLALQHCKPQVAVYQWHATARQALVAQAWKESGLLWHQTIIWRKVRGVLTHSHYLWSHEPCAYGWVEGKPPAIRPPASERTVWDVDQRDQTGLHPTQKPVELFARPIAYHTQPGDVVYEPFSGSGTQIIAGERLGRRCFAIEKEPAYVQVALERWQQFTGRKAVRIEEEGE